MSIRCAPRRPASCSTCRIYGRGWIKQTLIGADEILIVAAPDLANLRNTKNLHDCSAARPNDHLPLYCLKGRRAQTPRDQPADFAKAIEDEPMAIIPFEPQIFGTAANNGQMIAEISGATAPPRCSADRAALDRAGEPKKQRSGLLSPLIEKCCKCRVAIVGVASVFGKRPTGGSAKSS